MNNINLLSPLISQSSTITFSEPGLLGFLGASFSNSKILTPAVGLYPFYEISSLSAIKFASLDFPDYCGPISKILIEEPLNMLFIKK